MVGYAPTVDKSTSEKCHFWNSLDEAVKGVPSRNHLIVLMDANVPTGMRGIGRADRKVMSAYGHHELNDQKERLLLHATDSPSSTRIVPHPLVIYRTRFRALTEERPSTGLTTY